MSAVLGKRDLRLRRRVPAALEDREARMLLTSVVDGGDVRATSVVAEHGPVTCWDAIVEGLLGPALQQRALTADLETIAADAKQLGMRFIVPSDGEWPGGLNDLAAIGANPAGRGGIPIGLWLRGPACLSEVVASSVAIVGARAATDYGMRVAADFGYELAKNRIACVSGLALGVDVAAHRGAILGGSRVAGKFTATAAVLASGADVVYPKQHRGVYQQIAADGVIISECAIGATPTRVGFLARNRLIAALTQGTVLVEAAVRSGARNTVNWALLLGRVVMAVPGSVESALSYGPHAVIRDQCGVLVSQPAEVIEAISPLDANALIPPIGAKRPLDDLDQMTVAVYEALPSRIGASVGEIALKAGVPVPTALSSLADLESKELAVTGDGLWRLGRVS